MLIQPGKAIEQGALPYIWIANQCDYNIIRSFLFHNKLIHSTEHPLFCSNRPFAVRSMHL